MGSNHSSTGGASRRDLFRLGAAGAAALATTSADARAPGRVAASRRGSVTITQATNVALALSPDGRQLALDLLGLLWLMPASGGTATRISGDFDDLAQPDWMASGKRLVFQSYRTGHFHIWSCAADGSDWRQHTDGMHDNREVRASPDGRYLAFTSDRAQGRYAIHVADLASGAVRMLTSGGGQESEPCWSPDSQRIAFVADGSRLVVSDLAGTTSVAAAVPPSADRQRPSELRSPAFAPDGSLAYTVISAGAVTLMHKGKPLVAGEDLYPFRPAFGGDGSLFYAATGHIRRRSADGQTAIIPHRMTVPVTTPRYTRHRQLPAPTGAQPVLGIHAPQLSADGRRILFRALNDIWVMEMGAAPTRLVADASFKCDPAWSPEARSIVYSSDRAGTLDLWVRDIASGRDRQLTDLPGQAAVSAAWSPDGSQIAFLDQTGALHTVDAATGRVRKCYDALWEPGRPTWSPDGRFVALAAFRPVTPRYREGYSEILVVDLANGRGRYHSVGAGKSIVTRGDDGPVWSPDGRHLAYVMGSTLWVLPVDATGAPSGPARQITSEVTDAPSWRGDSAALLYQNNGRLRLVALAGGPAQTIPCPISWAAAKAPARTLVRAGRLWDGTGNSYARNADVVLDGNRIAAVRAASGPLPQAGQGFDVVIDGRDLAMIPGLIDMHTHRQMQGYGYGDRMDRLFLGLGITATRSPGCPAYQMVEAREALASGARTGPRHFACGEAVDGSRIFYNFMRPVTEPGQMALEMQRAQALGYDMIKTYVRMTHKVQAEVTAMAHAMGLHVSSHYHYPALFTGVDCMEHLGATSRYGYSRTVTALGAGYGDVNGLFAGARAARTPTLFGASVLMGEDGRLPADIRVRTLMPAWDLARLDARVDGIRKGDPAPLLAALERSVAQISQTMARGHHVIAGTDAPIDFVAISLHLNLRAMTRFGISAADALRTATAHAGAFLDEPLGVIAPGKLADVLLVGGDPLADVAAAADVRHIILDGRATTPDAIIAPFAGKAPTPSVLQRLAPTTAAAPTATALAARDDYWWHDAAWVEDGRGACCPDHARSIMLA